MLHENMPTFVLIDVLLQWIGYLKCVMFICTCLCWRCIPCTQLNTVAECPLCRKLAKPRKPHASTLTKASDGSLDASKRARSERSRRWDHLRKTHGYVTCNIAPLPDLVTSPSVNQTCAQKANRRPSVVVLGHTGAVSIVPRQVDASTQAAVKCLSI